MPAMTLDTLKVKLKALASVGDEAAVATLAEFDRLAAAANPLSATTVPDEQLKNALYVLQKIDDALSLAMTLVPGLKHGEATAAVVQHAKEVAAFDKAAKEYYAQIVISLTKLANSCRSKDRRLSVPAHDSNPGDGNELVNHFDSYVKEYGQKNQRIEFLEAAWKATLGVPAPKMEPGWNPGYTPQPVKEYVAEWQRLNAVRENPPGVDPEAVAAAATRTGMGLPAERDPVVTQTNTELPASHYDKSDKMRHQDGNQG